MGFICQAGRRFTPAPAQFGLDEVDPKLDWETPCEERATHVLCLDFDDVILLCCPHLHTITEAMDRLEVKRIAEQEAQRTASQYN